MDNISIKKLSNVPYNLPLNLIELWKSLSTFVKKTCCDRDESHGHVHMQQVAINSLNILMELNDINNKNRIIKMVITVAWLHDVSDHKYDPEHKLYLVINNFLKNYFNDDNTKLIVNIIDRISYSNENRHIINNYKLDWLEVLGEEGCLIRNIVSDADKLEALGNKGLKRCMMYTKEKNPEISHDDLVKEAKKHCDDKLLRLKDEFMRTSPGKNMATHLHDELVDVLKLL
jgi:HD superfamily phosphodiesterase